MGDSPTAAAGIDLRSVPGALLRFYWRTAIRLAFRNSAAQIGLLTLLVGLSPGDALAAAARSLASGSTGSLAILALWAGWNASLALDPLATTLRGWHRHLPVAGLTERRAAWAALAICQSIVLAAGLLLWAGGSYLEGRALYRVPIVLVLAAAASAAVLLPWARFWPRFVATAAFLLALSSTWVGLTIGALLLAAIDRWAGRLWLSLPVQPHRTDRKPRSGGLLLPWRIVLRALGWQLPQAWSLTALPLGATWLFLHNNALTPTQAALGVRIGGGVAMLVVLLPLAGALKTRRPAWPWIRSLPWTSRRRVVMDALLLGVAALPALIAATWLGASVLPALAATGVYQAIRLAGAVRHDSDHLTRLGAPAIVESCLVQLTVAASGWLALVWLLLCPWALSQAIVTEQARKVTRWIERHHLAAGDSST